MMKKISYLAVLIIVIISWSACSQGNGEKSKGDASISFDSTSYNFGEVLFESAADYEFVFTNSGKAPLIVTHVKSTCGCTIPEWSKEPVMVGGKGTIKVSYDTHRVGAFNKSIYVYSNAENGAQRLMISGKVKAYENL